MQHVPYMLEATRGGGLAGFLPLAHVRSALFGNFLVSLPYINSAGVVADDAAIAHELVDRAIQLANRLDVDYLELRHEKPLPHPSISLQRDDKLHMRLALPASGAELYEQLRSKVRNQLRKAESQQLTVDFGREDLLSEFYKVFSCNMRDLGTPVYSQKLFRQILVQFGATAELCVVRRRGQAVAAGLLMHEAGLTQVPSASSLRRWNHTNANMWMYWQMLLRATQRFQHTFDFGRCSVDSNTYRFKKQWGAQPSAATWQYYLRRGDIRAVQRDRPAYQWPIRVWRRLPVAATRLIGPALVRGIP